MTTGTPQRLASFAAAVAITFSILTGIADHAKPQAPSPLLAQAAATVVR